MRRVRRAVTCPTMFVWCDGDTIMLEKAARDCGRHVTGEFRFEILHGSHWLLDEQLHAVADPIGEWIDAHST